MTPGGLTNLGAPAGQPANHGQPGNGDRTNPRRNHVRPIHDAPDVHDVPRAARATVPGRLHPTSPVRGQPMGPWPSGPVAPHQRIHDGPEIQRKMGQYFEKGSSAGPASLPACRPAALPPAPRPAKDLPSPGLGQGRDLLA
ncbi:predicted protein [Histoplasma capsulatum H143]|uniref:Uncharacterized protein n=1 Tax=Ajellomyces capsulatus (strain H143) TaxID=544712 RepID=C6HK78_AJECH|nr:predicted protein [Histoplasma capsulatum H143]